ncbi:MAG: hypothetical protein ACJ79J_13230 [Gemmatimonadaceae bacterium]|jgi:hypothetical protein
MRLHTFSNKLIAVAAIGGLIGSAQSTQAQLTTLHPSFYGSAELDTRNSQFYLPGVYVGVGGLGWSPYFNANGYALHYAVLPQVSGSEQTLSAFLPTLGMAYASRSNGVSIGGGYAFVKNEDPGAPGAEGGGTSGATASLGAYHSGRALRSMHTQLLTNYNFDSHYVWARGRASIPFGASRSHPTRLGAELVGQGGGRDGATSTTWQAGPTVEYVWSADLRTTAAAGWKSVDGSRFAQRENAGYFKLEFSFSP